MRVLLQTNIGIFTEGNYLLHCISNLPLGVTNEGREAIKLISGAVAGDSSLQNRGVTHYLLSLLFSLVSSSFSLYFCVPYQKYQKYMLPCLLLLLLVPLKTPSCHYNSDFICT